MTCSRAGARHDMRDTVPPREMRYRGEARRGAGTAPDALRKAGRARIDAGLKKHGARRHAARTNRIIQALTKQTAMVAGTAAADTVPPHPARRLIAPRSQAGRRRVTRDGGFWVASSRAPSGTTSPPGSRPWCGPTLFTGRTSQPGPARPGPPPRHPARHDPRCGPYDPQPAVQRRLTHRTGAPPPQSPPRPQPLGDAPRPASAVQTQDGSSMCQCQKS